MGWHFREFSITSFEIKKSMHKDHLLSSKNALPSENSIILSSHSTLKTWNIIFRNPHEKLSVGNSVPARIQFDFIDFFLTLVGLWPMLHLHTASLSSFSIRKIKSNGTYHHVQLQSDNKSMYRVFRKLSLSSETEFILKTLRNSTFCYKNIYFWYIKILVREKRTPDSWSAWKTELGKARYILLLSLRSWTWWYVPFDFIFRIEQVALICRFAGPFLKVCHCASNRAWVSGLI